MDYYSVTMSNVTLLDCIEDYCYRGNRTLLNDGKIDGFVNEGFDEKDREFYKTFI